MPFTPKMEEKVLWASFTCSSCYPQGCISCQKK